MHYPYIEKCSLSTLPKSLTFDVQACFIASVCWFSSENAHYQLVSNVSPLAQYI